MNLGKLLREYDITSGNIRFPAPIGQVKGYQRADFADAWQRYCPDPAGEPSQPSQPSPPSSGPGRLATVVRLKPSQPTLDEMPPPPGAGTRGTA